MLKKLLAGLADCFMQQSVKGSASMVFMSLAFLTLLVSVNVSLSAYQTELVGSTVAMSESSALESIANGALQDIFAVRFYPASNRLNWQFDTPSAAASTDVKLKPFSKNSSFVMENGQVLARYQYVVIGGHPARRDAAVEQYKEVTEVTYPFLVDPESDNVQSSLYVLLRTFGCMNAETMKLEAGKILATNTGSPSCGTASVTNNADYVLKQYDLLAKIRLASSQSADNPDSFSVVYSKRVDFEDVANPVELDGDVLFPAIKDATESKTASVPTFGKNIRFGAFWPTLLRGNGSNATQANLEQLIIETSSFPTDFEPITGTAPVLISDLPVSVDTQSKIHLFFRGAMDARSFYAYNYSHNADTNGTITDPTKLNFQLEDAAGQSVLPGAKLEFNYPNADHVTIILPQRLACSNSSVSGSSSYRLSFTPAGSSSITKGVRDSYGSPASTIPSISLRTSSCVRAGSKGSYNPYTSG